MYVHNNPINHIDPMGLAENGGFGQQTKTSLEIVAAVLKLYVAAQAPNAYEFSQGAVDAYAHDNTMGASTALADSAVPQWKLPEAGSSYVTGAKFGHGVALLQGGIELVGGSGMVVGGSGEAVVAGPTVVGAVPGVVVAGAGAAIRTHGALVASTAWDNLVSMMSGSSVSKAARQRGVDRFWREEAERIKQGKPSRKWTPEQEEAILRGETPKSAVDRKPVEGAHKKSVQDNPELADNPENVEAKSFTEHRKKDSGEHSTNPKQHEISPNTTP